MAKDGLERRAYRRSPGRRYENDYNPSGRQTETTTRGANRSSGTLPPRPDPRLTRQLLRQNILASKAQAATLDNDENEVEDQNVYQEQQFPEDEQIETTSTRSRYPITSSRAAHHYAPSAQEYAPREYEQEDEYALEDPGFVDPDIGVGYDGYEGYSGYDEDPLDHRVGYADSTVLQSPARHSQMAMIEDQEPDVYDYAEEEEEAPEQAPRRKAKKKKKGLVSRRKLLLGAVGAATVGVAGYEIITNGPKLLQDTGTNLEHQLQDAYNKGIAAGAEAVRKDFINALDNMEGVSLDGAIGAARLTRVAYDVFVQPVITLTATITGDVLGAILQAYKTGHGWLIAISKNNATLDAMQTVLESWVKNVHNMPKQLQSITDADLDGAQSYLRGVKTKIQQEQAKLNGQSTATPLPNSNPKTTPTPKKQ